jgi:hypothetical protein
MACDDVTAPDRTGRRRARRPTPGPSPHQSGDQCFFCKRRPMRKQHILHAQTGVNSRVLTNSPRVAHTRSCGQCLISHAGYPQYPGMVLCKMTTHILRCCANQPRSSSGRFPSYADQNSIIWGILCSLPDGALRTGGRNTNKPHRDEPDGRTGGHARGNSAPIAVRSASSTASAAFQPHFVSHNARAFGSHSRGVGTAPLGMHRYASEHVLRVAGALLRAALMSQPVFSPRNRTPNQPRDRFVPLRWVCSGPND